MGKDTDIKIDTYTIANAPRENLNSTNLTEIFEIEPNKRHDIRSFIDPFYTRITCSNTSNDKVASFKFLDETDFIVDVKPQTVVTFKRKVNGKIIAFLNVSDVKLLFKITQEE